MPIYEFKCPTCNDDKVHTIVKKIAEWDTEEKCPTCSGVMSKQVSRGTRAIFNGPGYYVTDYGKRTKQ